MAEMKLNKTQQYIFNAERKLAEKVSPFLQGDVLKVGNGLGYLSDFLKRNLKLTVLDIATSDSTINKGDVIFYDGLHFPYPEKSFDCAIAAFVLHHSSDPLAILKEMKRVAKRIILVEETYTGLISKLDLVYRDIYVNTLADQFSNIHWNSYFSEDSLPRILSQSGFNVVHHEKEPKRRYFKEIYVLEC